MPGLVGKPDHLVLDGGAVSGPHPLDHPGEEGGAVQVGPDDFVGFLVGIGDVAAHPVGGDGLGGEGEGLRVPVPLLALQLGEVDGPGVHPGGRARLEPAEGEARLAEALGEGVGPEHAVGAAPLGHGADDGLAPQVGAGADHHRLGPVDGAGVRLDPGDLAGLGEQAGDLSLLHPEVFLGFQGVLHDLLVLPPVGLGPQGVDGGALPPVEHPVLDAGLVGGPGHLAPQGVQLPDQVALAGAPDGGVAGHVPHRVQVDGEAQGGQPQPGAGQGGLNPRVAGAHHDHLVGAGLVGRDVVQGVFVHGSSFYPFRMGYVRTLWVGGSEATLGAPQRGAGGRCRWQVV